MDTQTYGALMAKIRQIQEQGIDTSLIESAIDNYLKENPVDVDLTDYVKNTDYATANTGGVIKVGNGVNVSDGKTLCTMYTKDQYNISANNIFISRGTLENVKEDYVKRALTSDTQTLTADEQSTIKDKLGIEELIANNHRNIYRGKNLGSSVTDEQKTAIQNGTFEGLFIGDYWLDSNGVIWRIADMDYFYNASQTLFTTHHLIIVPDKPLYTAQMNDTATTAKGYVGTALYTVNMEKAKTLVSNMFGDLVLARREYLTNYATNSKPAGSAWYDSTVELMTEIMVYGTTVYSPASIGTSVPMLHTHNKVQLSLFRLNPTLLNIKTSYWLRDIVSDTLFALVDGAGLASCSVVTNTAGVRPYVAIGVAS